MTDAIIATHQSSHSIRNPLLPHKSTQKYYRPPYPLSAIPYILCSLPQRGLSADRTRRTLLPCPHTARYAPAAPVELIETAFNTGERSKQGNYSILYELIALYRNLILPPPSAALRSSAPCRCTPAPRRGYSATKPPHTPYAARKELFTHIQS